MSVYKQKINSMEVVFGLSWELLLGDGRSIASKDTDKLKKYLTKNKAKLGIVIKNNEGSYVGIDKSNTPKLKGTVSAAALLSKATKDPVIFAIKISAHQWWFLAVNKGIPIPETDSLLPSIDAIRHKIDDIASFGLFEIKTNDDDIIHLYEEAELIDFDEQFGLVDKKTINTCKIKQLSGLPPEIIIATAVIATLSVIGYFGYKAYEDFLNSKAREVKIMSLSPAQLSTIENKQIELATIRAIQSETKNPLIDELATDCINKLNQAHLFIGYWHLDKIECKVGSIHYAWQAERGALYSEDDLNAVMPEESFSFKRDTAALFKNREKPLSSKTQVSELENLKEISILKSKAFKSLLLFTKTIPRYSWDIEPPTIKVIPYQGPNNNGDLVIPKTVPNNQSFNAGKWRAKGEGLWTLTATIDKMPDNILIGTNITFTFSGGRSLGAISNLNWTMEGTYAVR